MPNGMYVLAGALIAAGCALLMMAYIFAIRQVRYVVYTRRDFTDFSGDIASWLRSEGE